jgi:hypothetical protein
MTLQEGFSGFSGSTRRNPDGAEWRVYLSKPQGAPVCPASPVSPVFPGCLDQMPEFTTTAIICIIVYAWWVVDVIFLYGTTRYAGQTGQTRKTFAHALLPMAATLAAEAHLLATLPPDGRPLEQLGSQGHELHHAGNTHAGAERAAVA